MCFTVCNTARKTSALTGFKARRTISKSICKPFNSRMRLSQSDNWFPPCYFSTVLPVQRLLFPRSMDVLEFRGKEQSMKSGTKSSKNKSTFIFSSLFNTKRISCSFSSNINFIPSAHQRVSSTISSIALKTNVFRVFENACSGSQRFFSRNTTEKIKLLRRINIFTSLYVQQTRSFPKLAEQLIDAITCV